MSNPCYNKETKTDCPKRHKGCAIDCPEWAAYCAERDKEYEERAEARQAKKLAWTGVDKRIRKNEQWVMRNRMSGGSKIRRER